ncbi:MAG: T9SS type A sorting domain-containing protein [Fluviicola sp.]
MKTTLLILSTFFFCFESKAQFGGDVTIQPSSDNQTAVEIASAFNGWLFSAVSFENEGTNTGGIVLRKSIDNGLSWSTVYSLTSTGVRYDNVDVIVTGSTEIDLYVSLAYISRFVATSTYDISIKRIAAATNSDLGLSFYLNKGTNKVYDIELASDYLLPASVSSPYSVAMLYSCYSSSYDSIVSVVSVNGGVSYGIKNTVATTGSYFRNISLDYGRSSSGSNGRYFAAWERLSSTSARTGGIYTSRNSSTVDGPWITPVNLDSVSSTMINLCRNPRIAVQHSTIDSDSGGVSAIVLVDRDYTGDGSDYDLLGFYNKRSHYSNFWYRFDVVNSNENDTYGDAVFDPVSNQFCISYLDSTNQQLKLSRKDFNMPSPSSWTMELNTINDNPALTKEPKTRLVFRPLENEVAIAWIDQVGTNGVAKIDAESFSGVGLAEQKGTQVLEIYPNPASEKVTISLENGLIDRVSFVDISGKLCLSVANTQKGNEMDLSVNELKTGVYFVTVLTTDNQQSTIKFIKK